MKITLPETFEPKPLAILADNNPELLWNQGIYVLDTTIEVGALA